MSLTNISKYIALILRHKPEAIDIALDKHGWANVNELIAGVNKTHPFSKEMLEQIVKIDDKQRFSYNEDKTLIRANQGHSISVDVELKETMPPKVLYHGTGEKHVASIDEFGLISKSRLYVHLTDKVEAAINVGSRHGNPVVYIVDAKRMSNDGYVFYISANRVWLTKSVPIKYLEKIRSQSIVEKKYD